MWYTSREFIPRVAGGPVTVVPSVVLNIPFFPIGGHNPISFRNFRTYNLSNDIEFWSRFFFNPQENLYANTNIFGENLLEPVRTREELGKKIRTKNNVNPIDFQTT